MTEQALEPVGRNCDCGHPLIWSRGNQLCAVYGSHPSPISRVHLRNLDAPGAPLIALLLERPALTRQTLASRRARAGVL